MFLDQARNMCVKERDCPMPKFADPKYEALETKSDCDGQEKMDKMVAETFNNKKFKSEFMSKFPFFPFVNVEYYNYSAT